MSSKRRIESSRANGAKSHGPVTDAGRLKSSRNNLRHGLLAGIVVLENEKPEAFTDLVDAFTREIGPQTEAQRALVETMAVARWRQMRLWAVERATLQSELEKHDPESRDAAPSLSLAFRALADQSRTLDLLNRYESRFECQFTRSLNLLMKLARPDNPLTQFCHTNPVPQPDTPSGPPPETETNIRWGSSGAGLLAGASAEGADQSPVEPAPTEATPPIANSHAPDSRPLTPDPHPKPILRVIMKSLAALSLFALACLVYSADAQTRDYPVKPVPFTAVHVNDGFWAPRIETNRTITIPYAFKKDEETGRIDNFIRAGKALRGEPFENHKYPPYPFDDTDVYKVLEGAAYTLSVHPDAKLEDYCDNLIKIIGQAQEPDGYLYTARTIDPLHPHPWSGNQRWILEGVNSHELYDLGHLYEAAVAYYQATGKRSLLDIALRTANLLDQTFGPGKREIWPGHQIVEMGLAKLYRVTGEQKYLTLAKFMLDSRGPQSKEEGAGNAYVEANKRVVDQTDAPAGGHAVRAMYMYSGMADVAALTGDEAYVTALDRIWDNVATRKLHITGGVGARAAGESFGADYELPNMSAYNETCAAVGNDYWNHRLFLLHADAKYIDVMERTLYNGLISGVSLEGTTFFYQNPLEATGNAGKDQRSPWFGVACCPGNITRFMASVPGYVYAQRESTLWVNLFVGSDATIKMDNGRTVKIAQQTRYPWDGGVKMTVTPDALNKNAAGELTINVRIPGWARNQPVPTDLYKYSSENTAQPSIKVNGKAVPVRIEKGYAAIWRTWKAGDTIELNLPMPIRRVVANSNVAADRGRVAIQRGPIMYTAEWVDNPDGKVRNLMLPDSQPLEAEYKGDLLRGVEVVKGKAVALSRDAQGNLVRKPEDITLIPYYAWANRGRGQMMVWLPDTEASAHPLNPPNATTNAKITTDGRKNPDPVKDEDEPASSADGSSYFDWWTGDLSFRKGWMEYAFDKPSAVSECDLYWFDDTGRGGVRVPATWRVLYKDGSEWKPVEATSPYGAERNQYNKVTFKPVTTTGLRLEVTMQPRFSAGVQRWRVVR
jgi:uncharacterized protein